MSGIDPQRIDAVSRTDVGRVRTVNQDRFAEFEDGRGRRLLVVADGMGGHRGGETASRLAVEAIGDVFQSSEEALEDRIRTAVETANRRLYETAQEDPDLAGMGTTVVALCFGEQGESYVAHVGDSRLYLLRAGRLEALTEDHSLVAEMQRDGFLSAEEAQVHPRRNELTRSVGVSPSVKVDVSRVAVEPGDRFLLCSDGLCGYLGDEEIREVLERERPPDAARTLVERANASGGYDNVTVQVVAIPDSSSPGRGGADARAELAPVPERRVHPLILVASVAGGLLLAAAVVWLLLSE
jgi:protein phosphatase